MRKRTIEARVERLWALTGYPRTFPKRGGKYCFTTRGGKRYVLSRGKGITTRLVKATAKGASGGAGALNALERYGFSWTDAHEYAHGFDWGEHKGALSVSLPFLHACRADGLRPIRPGYSDPQRDRRGRNHLGSSEMFADAIAYTIVNDREFLHEHPAKYAFARTFLKEQGVI